ncbi:putative helicase mov-10-B.2 isoform X2 [Salarias fasciatus]|uniref:putative helicase mov-10-B.2 isoform X2 n=1 Tax=Salarias fasciatus TaxID=181472 RepID=UPI00117700B0|nr:putative helicase mov-10-B.2 isoform X2 [Salarias fasciatus]
MNLSERCQIGLEFFEYLKETDRVSITHRLQLRDIYNNEFRTRNPGTKDPNFGSVLYGLKVFYKITRRGDTIRFNPKVKDLYVDQWQTNRTPPKQLVQNGAAVSGLLQQVTSAEEAETGVRARRKLAKLLINRLTSAETRKQFMADKNGVAITSDDPFEDGKLGVCVENKYEHVINLLVENSGTKSVYFMYYTPLHWLKYFSLSDEHRVTRLNPLLLQPGDCYEIKVNFSCSFVGFYPANLAFEFKADLQESSAPFYIMRVIEVQCMTSLGQELAPIAPYKARSIPAWIEEAPCTIVDGQRPDGLSVVQLKNEVQLKKYEVPQYMNQLINVLKQSGVFSDKRALLESPLSWERYSEKFQLLLFLEELQMVVDIKRYNIPNDEKEDPAVMYRDTVNKKLLVLEVPGVSENRPSPPAGQKQVKYRGYVHSVQLDQVKLGFGSELLDNFIDGMKFNVEFTVNRLTMRLQHRAAEFASIHQLKSVLFPAEPSASSQQTALPQLRLFDWQLERNPEQYQAVQHIVAGSSKPAPYLVFGPPGTGKTVTVVEAIKQIEKTQTSCVILACAPSNSAADLLCRKILDHVDERKVFRMYATSRDPKFVPVELKACSNLVGDSYLFPAKEKLMEYKIIVTTLMTAGRLVTGGIPEGHFTHVFVDEAGHAVETECLIPLAGLLDPQSGQVVLAGDPKQLGPIIRSPFAQKYGLGVSLLQRLMDNFSVYKKDDGLNNAFVTKLLQNYRSHPAILKVPNERFYDNELQVCADEILRNSYCRWDHLRKKDFPVIFHGVAGVDAREASSPSFFNVAEVEILTDYVKKLLQSHGKKGLATIGPRDIGIIAPYRKQVLKIRKALDKIQKEFKFTNMDLLKVGSVEEFQGQERRVIIVSTVRSSTDYLNIDKHFHLGFVKNEKRFNVAVTRAKALLIVVGNPRVLNTDETWAHFISYCSDEGGYIPIQTEEDEDVVVRLAALCLKVEPQVETAESDVQRLLDPEWRNDL